MSAWHLCWIVPVRFAIGYVAATLLSGTKSSVDYSFSFNIG